MKLSPATPSVRPASLRSAFTLVEVLVVMAILVIIAGTVTVGTFKYLDLAKRREAELKMQKIESAAKTYNVSYDQVPTDPMQLVQTSPDGSPPILEGGDAAALDPWGVPFTLTYGPDQTGTPRFRVTSTGSGTELSWPKN